MSRASVCSWSRSTWAGWISLALSWTTASFGSPSTPDVPRLYSSTPRASSPLHATCSPRVLLCIISSLSARATAADSRLRHHRQRAPRRRSTTHRQHVVESHASTFCAPARPPAQVCPATAVLPSVSSPRPVDAAFVLDPPRNSECSARS